MGNIESIKINEINQQEIPSSTKSNSKKWKIISFTLLVVLIISSGILGCFAYEEHRHYEIYFHKFVNLSNNINDHEVLVDGYRVTATWDGNLESDTVPYNYQEEAEVDTVVVF